MAASSTSAAAAGQPSNPSFTAEMPLKIIIIGDAAVGKTCLLMRYVRDEFKHEMNMTMGLDFLRKYVDWQGVRVDLRIWDTAGQERFGAMRSTAYRGAHGVMVAYSCDDPKSYDRVFSYWLPELVRNCEPNVPCIIVATKADLPQDKRLVTRAQGMQVALDCTGCLGGHATVQYAETSALKGDGVEDAFKMLVHQIMTTGSSFTREQRTTFKIDDPSATPTNRRGACCK